MAAVSLPVTISSEEQEYIWRGARFLREQGAKKVWLFGSQPEGHRPQVHSDFDFGVEDSQAIGSSGASLLVASLASSSRCG